jgi:hypothetical protein
MADRKPAPPLHPHTLAAGRNARGTGGEARPQATGLGVRAMILSPATERERWIESELSRARAMVQIGYSVRQIIMALCEDPPPRPQILVMDLDTLSPGELIQLHEIRERGWFGTVVALGQVPPALRKSLQIERVLCAPFVEDMLVDALDRHRIEMAARTIPLPMFPA